MKNRKVHSLTGRITPELVYAAWRAVRANRGAAGIDKVSVQMFEQNVQPNLEGFRAGSYRTAVDSSCVRFGLRD